DDLSVREGSAAHTQRGAAMRADVVIRLDRVPVDPHHQDGLIADVIHGVVAVAGNLVQPRRHLPYAAPQLLVLQARKAWIDVAAGGDAMIEHVPARWPLRIGGLLGSGASLGRLSNRYDAHCTLRIKWHAFRSI